ncbi:Uncharacterized protein FKW44_013759, partial [Caligus rogercresseyi]
RFLTPERKIQTDPKSCQDLDMFWPPNSPDLNPCDYYLWGVLKRTLTSVLTTRGLLEAAIIQAVANLSRKQVAHADGRFRHRVEAVIVRGGSWIE